MSDSVATAIYGIYTAGVYLAALPGGWVADRILGPQRAVMLGGVVIACGHFTLALDRVSAFYAGLLLIMIGTGLLKPNISALVGSLYPEGGARRDSGFTIFYMGINLGAAIGPLVCSALGERVHWRYGFAAAGVGMVLGLVQFALTRHHLQDPPATRAPLPSRTRAALIGAGIFFIALLGLCFSGAIRLDAPVVAGWLRNFISLAAIVYFAAIFLFGKLDSGEKKRVALIGILFVAAALFWMGFEQVGSSFNLFAERFTERKLFGSEIPAGWFQSLGPIFVIAFSPVFAALWVRLAARSLNPSIPVKFGIALLLLAGGFLAMCLAAKIVAGGHKAGPGWLVATYLLHTFGELCLSPVGLSSVTKLAPQRLVGQMMGVWFLGASLGNLMAGLLAGNFDPTALDKMPAQFLSIAIAPLIAGAALILLARRIRRSLADV